MRRLVAVVVLASVALVGCGRARREPISATSPVAPGAGGPGTGIEAVPATGPAGPTKVVAGVPIGFSRDRRGGIAAAVSFARLNEALVLMSEDEAIAARRAMAAEGAEEALVADIEESLGKIRGTWPQGTLSERVAPLAVKVSDEEAESMRVDVWYVGVVAGRNLATYEEWVTESYRLRWEDGDWRVAALSEVAGPRPDPGRQEVASAAELEGLLSGFESVP